MKGNIYLNCILLEWNFIMNIDNNKLAIHNFDYQMRNQTNNTAIY